MARYALLIMPSANRVYANAAVALTQAELEVFSRSVLGGRLTGVTASTIGGVPYVTFAADLAGRDAEFLRTSRRSTRCSGSRATCSGRSSSALSAGSTTT